MTRVLILGAGGMLGHKLWQSYRRIASSEILLWRWSVTHV